MALFVVRRKQRKAGDGSSFSEREGPTNTGRRPMGERLRRYAPLSTNQRQAAATEHPSLVDVAVLSTRGRIAAAFCAIYSAIIVPLCHPVTLTVEIQLLPSVQVVNEGRKSGERM